MKQNILYPKQKIYKKGLTKPLEYGIMNTQQRKGIDNNDRNYKVCSR